MPKVRLEQKSRSEQDGESTVEVAERDQLMQKQGRPWFTCEHAQWCPTLCDPLTVAHLASLSMGFLQARILERVAISSSRESS